MEVKQIATLLNTITTEIAQGATLVNEDLSNVVDVGTTIFSSNWKENYCKTLIDRIGKYVYVDRPYTGYAPSILRSDWEFGSILAKTRAKDFEAVENPSWKLTAGQTVDQFEYNPPEVQQTFFNMREAWQIDCSYAEEQVKSAFTSAQELNSFFSMIETTIYNSRNQKLDAIVMRTINNFMAEKIHASNGVIHTITEYYNATGQTVTAATAPYNKDYLRFLAYLILDIKDRLKVRSEVYNMNTTGYPTATPDELLHVILNSAYGRGLDVFLQSDTFHNEFTKIGSYDTVAFWQGSGSSYSLTDRTSINVKLASDNTVTVNESGIIGVMFDHDAVAINNTNVRVTSSYNSNGEYYNNFYKCVSNSVNDTSEGGIVLMAD